MTRRVMWAALLGAVGLKAQVPQSSENVVGIAWDERKPRNGQCPCCGAEGQELGAVAVGNDHDPYFSNLAWIPSKRLCCCPKCGNLFAKKAEGATDGR